MKLFSMRPRRSAGEARPASGFTSRQVTAVAVAVSLAFLLWPAGARASSALINAVVTDPAGTNKAQVDASGNLQVGGTVGAQQSGTWNVGFVGIPKVGIFAGSNTVKVDSTVPISVTSADDPGREAFEHEATMAFSDGDTKAIASFDIPTGTRMVITYISGELRLPSGEQAYGIGVESVVNDSGAPHFVVPTITASTATLDVFDFAQETQFYADPSSPVALVASRSAPSGNGSVVLTVSGYLIDCSHAPVPACG
jgi:hypothetical protein